MLFQTDIAIIGSGIAGLSFAIKLAEKRPDLEISIFTKEKADSGNTTKAQGGIAVVLDQKHDSYESHFQDTMKAGKGFNDAEIVRMVVQQAPERLSELLEWGSNFDLSHTGEFDLGLEGGHSYNRILHKQDFTGLEIQTKLLAKVATFPNIHIFSHYFVTDLLIKSIAGIPNCIGLKVLDLNKNILSEIKSRVTFLATGGSGKLFSNSTNPPVATADGVAMAFNAGAEIADMNFVQFHPTALYEENGGPLFLISEAVRGFGAYLINKKGKRFLFEHDERGELATRDIISAAILKELSKSGEKSVFLDCSHLDQKKFRDHFPTIVKHCREIGIHVETDPIPVIPAAHYQCGGIKVDKNAQTSIKNLFASGECSCTGLHGSNRLASNSLLEALVFSHQAVKFLLPRIDEIKKQLQSPSISMESSNRIPLKKEAGLEFLKSHLKKLMSYELVYIKPVSDKKAAIRELEQIQNTIAALMDDNCLNIQYYEIRNLVTAAKLVLLHAILFEEKQQTKKGVFLN
ncbi:L-aspartate oxidase [Christiangramia fulva]|uniref:L-aspartate oxidase n=1 Tax=Christiangramia fulva TaxID=2126553 RepID=A0A2R3Z6V7_9FLAO|nr:L-aspartate oxidase [Christiangramia fulva]AVR45968.1 L-aspartate oxidase [Christiangramia fulva]